MDDEKKVAETLLGLGVLGALIYGLTRPKKEEIPPGEGAASISISVLDAQGNPVPHNSPTDFAEGAQYTIRLTVKNLSTKGGVAYAATLTVVLFAGTNELTFIPVSASSYTFAANETKTLDSIMVVPMGAGGQAGNIVANVNDPAGNTVAEAPVYYFNITTVPIIYGATITIGV